MAGTNRAKRYWVVKGNKAYPNQWDDRDGNLRGALERQVTEGVWATRRRVPDDFSRGDRVFFWSSSPDCFVIGLGKVENPCLGNDGDANRFLLKFLAGPLKRTVSIGDLRETLPRRPEDNDVATFLKAAAAQTIYPLTPQQAKVLADAITRDPDNKEIAEVQLQEWGLIGG